MKKIIKEIELYTFGELEKDIQENLIEKRQEQEYDTFCEIFLLDEMEEKAKQLLEKYFKNKASFDAVHYDFSYSQGSGAMIEFTLDYYNENIKIKQSGHYTHENSFTIDCYELSEKREEKLHAKIEEMNGELTKYGYSLLEYISEEEATEQLSQYYYLQNGEEYEEIEAE